MKEIKINLSDEKQKELNEKIKNQLSRQGIRRIIVNVLLIICTIMLTILFSKIGSRTNHEFIFGQLSILLIFLLSYSYNFYLSKVSHKEIEKIIFEDTKLTDIINQEIEKYEEEK